MNGDNVEAMFKHTANKILRRIEKGEINPETESVLLEVKLELWG